MRNRLAAALAVAAALLLLLGTSPASAAPPTPPASGVAASHAAGEEARRILDQHVEVPAAERVGGATRAPSVVSMPQSSYRPRDRASSCAAVGRCASAVSTPVTMSGDARTQAEDAEVDQALKASGAVCSTTATEESRWRANSRTSGCAVTKFTITVTEKPANKVVGRSTLFTMMTMAANGGRASFNNTAYVWVSSYSGVGAPTWVQGELITLCDKVDCMPEHAKWGHADESRAWKGSSDLAMFEMKKNQSSKTGGYWAFAASNPEWTNVTDMFADIGTGRCDDKVGGYRPGCVIPTYRPTWAIPIRDNPAFTSHVDSALGSGLPGSASKKAYLTRLTDSKKRDKNGRTACPSKLKRPKGDSCDEYPFRSTYQGAYTGNTSKQRKARSFPGCQMDDPKRTGKHGWSRCFIPEGQNGSAGGQLVGFYGAQRVLDKDKFYVGFA